MDVIGHGAVTRFLESAVRHERVSHAYLFDGPASVGKTTVAARLLHVLLGVREQQEPDAHDPFAALRNHPDVSIVEREEDPKTEKRKKNISVEQVRRLRERLTMGSFLPSWKVGVIAEAETLSDEAANALLKTLEEPTGKALLILLATSAGVLPATVASRCQRVRFHLVPEAAIREGLLARGASDAQADSLAAVSDGRPGVALRAFLDPAAAAAEAEAAEAFANALGAPAWQRIRFAEARAPEKAAAAAADEALATLRVWEAVLRDALVARAGQPALAHRLALRDRVAAWAGVRKPEDILRAVAALEEARAAIRENVPPRLAFEHVLLAT